MALPSALVRISRSASPAFIRARAGGFNPRLPLANAGGVFGSCFFGPTHGSIQGFRFQDRPKSKVQGPRSIRAPSAGSDLGGSCAKRTIQLRFTVHGFEVSVGGVPNELYKSGSRFT